MFQINETVSLARTLLRPRAATLLITNFPAVNVTNIVRPNASESCASDADRGTNFFTRNTISWQDTFPLYNPSHTLCVKYFIYFVFIMYF
jgi:hypothetical protein